MNDSQRRLLIILSSSRVYILKTKHKNCGRWWYRIVGNTTSDRNYRAETIKSLIIRGWLRPCPTVGDGVIYRITESGLGALKEAIRKPASVA